VTTLPAARRAADAHPWQATPGDHIVAGLARHILVLPLAVRAAVSVALLGAMAAIDVATGNEVSFSIFYLLPVSFAGALISRRAGIVMAVASAATWGFIEIATGTAYSAAWIPYWNTGVRLGFFVLVNELIERLRRAHGRERAMAREDPLTGIANTRVFSEHAERVIASARRTRRPFTVAYVDLDGFKQVNDQLGHSEGDRLLRTVALVIADSIRATDLVARLGGDEFAILMPETGATQAGRMLSRVASLVAAGTAHHTAVAATIGAVTFIDAPESVDQALGEADALMYRGKTEGRGRILQETWPRARVGRGV
jgi:diguanylate cyclase (GGDEF)-like protein